MAFWITRNENPGSGNFNLFEGYEVFLLILAGIIYGGLIGIVIGLLTGTFYILIVQSIENSVLTYLLMGLFGIVIGFVGYLISLDVFAQTADEKPIAAGFFILSIFLASFIPFIVVRRFAEL